MNIHSGSILALTNVYNDFSDLWDSGAKSCRYSAFTNGQSLYPPVLVLGFMILVSLVSRCQVIDAYKSFTLITYWSISLAIFSTLTFSSWSWYASGTRRVFCLTPDAIRKILSSVLIPPVLHELSRMSTSLLPIPTLAILIYLLNFSRRLKAALFGFLLC